MLLRVARLSIGVHEQLLVLGKVGGPLPVFSFFCSDRTFSEKSNKLRIEFGNNALVLCILVVVECVEKSML